MTIEDAPQEQQESVQERASYRAECFKTTEEYQPLMDMMKAVEKRNKAVVEGNVQDYLELTDEMFGDV